MRPRLLVCFYLLLLNDQVYGSITDILNGMKKGEPGRDDGKDATKQVSKNSFLIELRL